MKFVARLLSLMLALWLAGCATNANLTPSSNTTAEAAEGEPSESVSSDVSTEIYPSGGLKPLSKSTLGNKSVHTLLPPTDVWDRIRRGFDMPDLDTDLVRERELWYSSRPEYVTRMTERGRKYLFYIVEELERRNMPSELALLPFIESAFNPQAVSSAKAAGMWQFMPATGKTFDLKQNMFRDDRRGVIESTRAALDYMQKLYGMFGDWHLALAAYNWGEGSVKRAIAKANKAGTSTAYVDLAMPMETRFYVPKLQAVKNIVANPEFFRVTLPVIENHPYFQAVDLDRDIDVTVAAKLAEMSLDDFKALNPAASKPVLLSAGTSQILLPWNNAERFQSNLEAFGGRLATWTAWVAPSTLKPQEAAKHVGMSEAELRAVNQIPPRMLIKSGSALLVRRSSSIDKDVTEHVADHGFLALSPDVVLRKTVVTAGKRDSVATLANRYMVSAQSVASWNKTSTTAAFKAGQKVVLYLPGKAAPTRTAKNTTKGPSVLASKVASAKKPSGKNTSKPAVVAKKTPATKSPQLATKKAVRVAKQ